MNGATAQGQGRIAARPPIRAAHLRTDPWWALPVTVVVVLLSFIVYSTWAASRAVYMTPVMRTRSPAFSDSTSASESGGVMSLVPSAPRVIIALTHPAPVHSVTSLWRCAWHSIVTATGRLVMWHG